MRQAPRFASAGYVKASVQGQDYDTADVSEKGTKLVLNGANPFVIGDDYILYLFFSESRDSPAESAWSVMGECRWIKEGHVGFAFRGNSFVEQEIQKILTRSGFGVASKPDAG